MVYFNKQIVDTATTNPIVITIADFSATAITDFVVLKIKNIEVSSVSTISSPSFLTLEASGGGNVKLDNTAQTQFIKLPFKSKNDVYTYWGNNESDDAIIKFPAATTTITLTIKDDSGASISFPVDYYQTTIKARIIGK